MDRDAVVCSIYEAIRRANALREPGAQIACSEEAPLFGPGGQLDSLGLVSLILDVEELVNERAGVGLQLADERAMTLRRNPFRDVRSLSDYIVARLAEERPCVNYPTS
jgi:hypothetical protein